MIEVTHPKAPARKRQPRRKEALLYGSYENLVAADRERPWAAVHTLPMATGALREMVRWLKAHGYTHVYYESGSEPPRAAKLAARSKPTISKSRVWTARDALAGGFRAFQHRPAYRAELFEAARDELPSLTDEELDAGLAAMIAAGNIEARAKRGLPVYQYADWWRQNEDVCATCGGTGTVPHSYTYEAGHRVDDPLPCPACGERADDESPPF